MRFSKRHFVMASVILASTLCCGQQPQINAREINGFSPLLVRMSFASTWGADYEYPFLPVPKICFSVDHNGRYQMRRLTMKIIDEPLPATPNAKPSLLFRPSVELLQGTLPPGELGKLEKLLEDPDFLKITGSTPNILRQGAETFVAEVPRENGVQRAVLSDADGENPFPHSAEKIVNWLRHFKAEGGMPLNVSEEDICPSATLQPVNPATAWLQPVPPFGSSLGGSCWLSQSSVYTN